MPRNPLLQKRALDALLEGFNDPEYATHQHHSDPDFTTQNGKDYAGRNTTEPEAGALKDGIPASLLSVELGKRADVDNPHVTTIPSAPAEVDPSDATFFKESDQMSPAEEKIMSIVAPQGFSYGAHVDDGTTLFVRGASDWLSFDPKTGLVTFLRGGKVALQCPINQLKESVSVLKSSAQIFHETPKRELGQDKEAAIRPSPSKVFEDKVDKATGQNPPAPKNPDDSDVDAAKKTLEDAGYGDMTGNQIGMNAASKWGDKIKKMEARRGESIETTLKTAEEHGNVPDTGEYDEAHEAHVREEAKGWAQYAEEEDNTDEIKPYDPSGCYDDATRTLTRTRGFQHFYDLLPEDEVATLVNEELVWEKPIASIRYWYEGQMYAFKTSLIDQLITPNHRVYWRNGHSNRCRLAAGKSEVGFRLSEIASLNFKSWNNVVFKRNAEWCCATAPATFSVPQLPPSLIVQKYKAWGKWRGRIKEFTEKHDVSRATVHRWKNGESDPRNMYASSVSAFQFEDWLEFLGWYLSEGSTALDVKRVTISQSKSNNRTLIAVLLKRMGVTFYTDGEGLHFYHAALCAYLSQFGMAQDKFIPQEIKELAPDNLSIILRSLVKGDGTSRQEEISERYFSCSKRLVEDVAEIALKCGYGVTISSRPNSMHGKQGRILFRVAFTKNHLTPKCGKPKIVDFKGWVSCVQVSSGVIFVERNGKTCWSGNSYLCGTCDMRRGANKCARVDGEISFTTGSCRLYHLGDPENDPPMKKKFSKEDAKYGENPEGFGCGRCEYGSKAKASDSSGRESFCSFWGMHVISTACCAEWEKGNDTAEHKPIEKDSSITKSYGSGTPSGGTPNDPTEDVQDEEDTKTGSAKTADIGIKETPTMLPPRDDLRRHLDEDVKDEVMEGVMDGVKDTKVADYELDRDEEAAQYLDTIDDMKNEAKAAFMEDPSMQQYAVDAELTMDELWKEIGESYIQNFYESTYSKRGSADACPNCGLPNSKAVKDGIVDEGNLRECLTCGSFYRR